MCDILRNAARSCRCELLLGMSPRSVLCVSVCWSRIRIRIRRCTPCVGHDCEPRQTNDLGADSRGPNELCIRCGAHWRHLASTVDRCVRRCEQSLPLLLFSLGLCEG